MGIIIKDDIYKWLTTIAVDQDLGVCHVGRVDELADQLNVPKDRRCTITWSDDSKIFMTK